MAVVPDAPRFPPIPAFQGSLERLGSQRVTLYLQHWPGFFFNAFANDAYIQGLADVVDQGLAQAVGVSNFNADRVRRAAQQLQVGVWNGEKVVQWRKEAGVREQHHCQPSPCAGVGVLRYRALGGWSALWTVVAVPMCLACTRVTRLTRDHGQRRRGGLRWPATRCSTACCTVPPKQMECWRPAARREAPWWPTAPFAKASW